MKHELMKLPFEYDALEPHMSKETLNYHHDKHHQTYVNKLNELVVDTKFEDSDLVEIIKQSDGGILIMLHKFITMISFGIQLLQMRLKCLQNLKKN